MRKHAEEVRRSREYSADNVAVRAAARYCVRTGKDWHVGYGGRCELGKRALKQWWYELVTMPVQRAWSTRLGRVLMIAVPILALIALLVKVGLGGVVVGVLIALACVGIGAIYALGVMAAKAVTNVKQLPGYLRTQVAKHNGFLKALVFVAATIGLPIVLVAYGLYRLFDRYGEYIAAGLFILLCVGLLAGIVAFFVNEPLGVLITFGVIFGIVGLVLAVSYGVTKLKKLRHDRVYAREHSPDAVNQAYQRIEPVLRASYNASLSDVERKIVDFDAWTKAFSDALKRHGYTWVDLTRPRSSTSDLLSLARDCDLAFLEIAKVGRFGCVYLFGGSALERRDEFVNALWDYTHPEAIRAIDRKVSRKQRRAEVLATLIDLWYSFKLGVCPTVTLPALDEVVEAADIPWQIEDDE